MTGSVPLRDRPDAQGVFLAVLRETRTLRAAARAAGIGEDAARRLRAADPGFARQCIAALTDGDGGPAVRTKITSAQRDSFVAALAAGHGVARAAGIARIAVVTAYELRRRDAAFARRWAEARTIALELAEDELLRRALDGFVRIETKDGVERRIVMQEWRPLLALLARRAPVEGRARYKTIELTPEVVATAKARVTRMLTLRGGHRWAEADAAPNDRPDTKNPASPDGARTDMVIELDDTGRDRAALPDFASLRDGAP